MTESLLPMTAVPIIDIPGGTPLIQASINQQVLRQTTETLTPSTTPESEPEHLAP